MGISRIHSLLFLPGNRLDRVDKALAAGASMICIDLEDAVAPEDKGPARDAVAALLRSGLPPRAAIRINALSTRDGLMDLLALIEAAANSLVLVVPKVAHPCEILLLDKLLEGLDVQLLPIVESCEGLRWSAEIARAPRVHGLVFGGGDLAAELGVKLEWEPLLFARSAIVQAAAAAEIEVIDVPYIHIHDQDGLSKEAASAKALGFAGKAAIHPTQVETIERCFRPSKQELDEAAEAIAAYEVAGRRVTAFRGRLLEAPIIKRYWRMLESAD